jgi:hypothetical protein
MRMARAKKQKPEATPVEEVTIDAYKGFAPGLICSPGGKPFTYEIGKVYEHNGAVVRCASGGFHSCEMPLDVWSYYGPANSVFCTVKAAGSIDREEGSDTKIASAKITVVAEIKLPALIKKAVDWIVEHAKGSLTTGNYAHAASTGNYAHAASTGYGAHAASTGNYAHAASTGYGAHAASTGNYAHAASTGNGAHAASTGYGAHAASTGKHGIAASLGKNGTAKAGPGGWLVLSYWNDDYELIHVRSAKVGTEGIEAGKTYRLNADGNFVEAEA